VYLYLFHVLGKYFVAIALGLLIAEIWVLVNVVVDRVAVDMVVDRMTHSVVPREKRLVSYFQSPALAVEIQGHVVIGKLQQVDHNFGRSVHLLLAVHRTLHNSSFSP
jgi:hypothetical protein